MAPSLPMRVDARRVDAMRVDAIRVDAMRVDAMRVDAMRVDAMRVLLISCNQYLWAYMVAETAVDQASPYIWRL